LRRALSAATGPASARMRSAEKQGCTSKAEGFVGTRGFDFRKSLEPTCTGSTPDVDNWTFDAGVLPYVLEPKRLKSLSGHTVAWRMGVDFQHAGSFTHNAKFLSCPWGRGSRRVCE
jgi:hypothetical protein